MYDEDWRCLLPPSVVWSPGGSMLLDLVATALPFPYTLTGMIQSYFAHLVDVRMWWANAIQLEWQRRLLIQQEYTKAMTVQNSVCSDALLHFCIDGGLRWGHVQIEVWGIEATCWRGKVKEICFADRSVWGEDVEMCTCKRMISISCFFQLGRNYMQTARTIRSKDLFCLEVTDQWTGLLATGSTAYSSFSNLFELFTLVQTAYCSIAAFLYASAHTREARERGSSIAVPQSCWFAISDRTGGVLASVKVTKSTECWGWYPLTSYV